MVQHSRRLRASVAATVFLLVAMSGFADEKFDELIQKGSYDKAIEYADKNLPAKSRTVKDWVGLATSYSKTEKSEKALEALKAAQKVNPSEPIIFMAYGDYYFQAKKYSEALQNYQKSYLLDRTASAAEGIALTAARLKDWDKARDAAESAINLDSTLYEPRLILIDLYVKDGLYDMGAEQLEVVVKKQPSRVRFWKQLSLCYDSTGNKQGLARADEKIVELDKRDVAARHRLAGYLLEKKNDDKAYELYKEIAVLTPNDSRPFEKLYSIAKAKDNRKDATLYLKNYLLLDSTNASYHKELGDLLHAGKDGDGALEAYRRALKLDPKIKGLYKNYASIVIDKKLEDEAVSVITGAIKANEADVQMLVALADIYKKRKNYAGAIEMYQDALKADPKDVAVLTSLAQSQALKGDLKDAAGTYEQVVLLNQKADDEYKQLGMLNMKLGKKDNAIDAYKKYLTKKPGDEEAARIVGLYEHDKKGYQEAVKYLSMVKAPTLQTVAYLTALGDSYFKLGKHKEAAAQFATVVAKKPDQAVLKEILQPLGQSYEKTGKPLDAAKAYDQYLQLPGIRDEEVAFKRANLREKSDKATAIKIYAENTTSYPKDFRNFLRLGFIYAQDNSTLAKSADMLEKSTALVDTIASVWQTLGEVYGKLNNADKELVAYKKLLTLKPQDVGANKRVGLLLLDKGQTSEAITHLEVALTSAPKDEKILLALGDGYMKTKRPNQAAVALAKARDLRPNDVSIRLALIDAYVAADMKANATTERADLSSLDKTIVDKDKKNIDSRQRLAQYSLEKNDLKTAYALYKDLSSLTPKDTSVFKRLYQISMKDDQKKDAVRHLKDYIALDSTTSGAYKSLGNLLYEQKDMDGALHAFRRAAALDAKVTGIYERYIEIVLQKNLEDEAVKVINRAIAVKEADAKSYIALGNIYKKRKKWDDAIKMYQQALQTDTKNVAVLTSLAECQAAAGDAKNAIITYEQVVLINADAVSEHKKLGDLQMQQKNADAAIASYKKYIKKNSADGEVARIIGLYEYEKKKYKEAIHFLNLVKEKKLQDVEYYTALGLSHYKTGGFKEASGELAKVQTLKPSATVLKQTLRPLAESYEKINKPSDAAKAYAAYTSLAGVSDEDASFKTAHLRENTDKNAAVKIYTANTARFPKDHRNFVRLGLIYAEDKSKLKESASMLSKAASLVDTLPVVWKTLGRVHGKLKNADGELKSYKKLLTLDPQDLEANKRVGTMLLKQGQISAAIANLEMALTAASSDVEVMLLLAEGYQKTKRPKQAVDLLAKAKQNRKDDAGIRGQLYKLYKEIGQEKKAEEEIRGLIALTKDNEYRRMYALDLIQKKRYDEALKQVMDIRKSEPMNIEGLMLLATVQQAQNKLNEAIETYKMVSYVNDAYAPALTARADVYLKQKDIIRAKSYYEKALQADGKFAMAELGLARVAKLKKDIASYQKHLNRAKTLDPKNSMILSEIEGNGN
ncbi:MAG: tetratricopeptide repeat protein [Chitinivibrionales bacterium]